MVGAVDCAFPERRERASEEYMMRLSCILEQVGMERFAPHISNSLPKIGFLHLESELHSWDLAKDGFCCRQSTLPVRGVNTCRTTCSPYPLQHSFKNFSS